MAGIAESLAAKGAEGLLDKVVNELYATASMLVGLHGEVQFIREELKMMSAFLRGAEEKQSTDRMVQQWVKQVKELVYDAEDVIEEYSLHLTRHHNTNLATALWHPVRSISNLVARRRRIAVQNLATALWHPVRSISNLVVRRRRIAVQNLATALWHPVRSISNLVARRRRIAVQIRSIKLRVEELSERRLRYGITHEASTSADVDVHGSQYDPRLAALFVDDSQLVGIDEPREFMVRWLLDGNEPRLSLMVVVGAGGSGKTTVARKAFESPDITSGCFPCRVWITVSQVYSIPVLLREMIRQLISPPPPEALDQIALIQMLRGHLQHRRYVVIIDDIWQVNAWNSLQGALPKNDHGSRIIITTRNNDVANSCSTGHIGFIHKLEKLSDEQSRELLYKRMSLDHDTFPEIEKLEKLSQNILRKCDGLPLVIVSIAAALASKSKDQIKEWEAMINRLDSEFESNPNLQNAMQVLNFSYTDLPYDVKQCFLYLSKFPEDSLINSKRIKSLWIAEGLINVRRGMSSKDVAESYLNELVSRHMVLPSVFSAVTGKVKSFKIHDVMLEMIISKATEENFLTLAQEDSMWTQQEAIRRLSVITEKFSEEMLYVPEGIDISHVKSLTIFGSYRQAFFTPRMRLLRVLDLEGYRGLSDDRLVVFCHLLLLKYLSLKDTWVRKLPSRMGNLCNLETLDIRGCCIETIPNITKLKRLRFLRSGYGFDFPSEIGKLRSLHELGVVKIDKERMTVLKGLQELTQLRKLSVDVDEIDNNFCVSRLFLEKLGGGSLRSLSLCVDSIMIFPDDVEPPPSKLESLKLEGPIISSSGPTGRQLPHWFSSLDNLARLSLRKTEIGEDAQRTIGALPNLIKLHLRCKAYSGDTLCFRAQEFPSLKVLTLDCNYIQGELGIAWVFIHQFLNATTVIFEEGALQCVGSVSISEYEKILGVENLTSLSDITLDSCSEEANNQVKAAVAANRSSPRLIIRGSMPGPRARPAGLMMSPPRLDAGPSQQA